MKVLYIHGFASAGSTGSATQLRNHFYPKGVQVLSPDVPVEPLRAIAFLRDYVVEHQPDLVVATSMGAMYAEQLRGIRRILVNPSFHMAKLLTFRGMGRQEFRNKREDGAKDFKVDKQMIAEFKEVEKQSFLGITSEEKQLVWGLFGIRDKNVNCQPDFRKHYGTAQMSLFEGEHYLNGEVLGKVIIPLTETILCLR
ncbi:MAG: YqiA/YcfP family alpha/beta fold hydrolase [Bacteroidaceae bacterium]|nr:YqiA/YcfP family alpha/beta fold hydrolase [Bacteroidaceae bacterium]